MDEDTFETECGSKKDNALSSEQYNRIENLRREILSVSLGKQDGFCSTEQLYGFNFEKRFDF